MLGTAVGLPVGRAVGLPVGLLLGTGRAVGLLLGTAVGLPVGRAVGLVEGAGATVGLTVGLLVGLGAGLTVGLGAGVAVGLTVGFAVGLLLGTGLTVVPTAPGVAAKAAAALVDRAATVTVRVRLRCKRDDIEQVLLGVDVQPGCQASPWSSTPAIAGIEPEPEGSPVRVIVKGPGASRE